MSMKTSPAYWLTHHGRALKSLALELDGYPGGPLTRRYKVLPRVLAGWAENNPDDSPREIMNRYRQHIRTARK